MRDTTTAWAVVPEPQVSHGLRRDSTLHDQCWGGGQSVKKGVVGDRYKTDQSSRHEEALRRFFYDLQSLRALLRMSCTGLEPRSRPQAKHSAATHLSSIRGILSGTQMPMVNGMQTRSVGPRDCMVTHMSTEISEGSAF